MSTATHTPGPWTVVSDQNGRPNAIAAYHDMRTPGGVGHIVRRNGVGLPSSPIAWSNACLIAAAPDLLAVLHLVRAIIVEAAATGFNCHDGDWAERLFASQAVTHAAVRKAEGKS